MSRHLVLGAMASLGFVLRVIAGGWTAALERFDDALMAIDDDPAELAAAFSRAA